MQREKDKVAAIMQAKQAAGKQQTHLITTSLGIDTDMCLQSITALAKKEAEGKK